MDFANLCKFFTQKRSVLHFGTDHLRSCVFVESLFFDYSDADIDLLYKLNYGILARIFLELFAVMSVADFEVLDDLVGVHGMLADIDDADSHVGAMVTHALEVGNEIRPNKSGFNGAGTISESYDMVITKECFETVNYLLKRLNVVCGDEVVVEISLLGQGENFVCGGVQHGDFFFGDCGGKGSGMVLK